MVRDPRPWLAMAAAIFGVWTCLGVGLADASRAAVFWPAVAWLGALVVEEVSDSRRRMEEGFFEHLMTPISVLGLAFVLIGDTAPILLDAVYRDSVRAIPEQFRSLPYYGLFDGDWWNAAWVFPVAAGTGLALVVFDFFVRGPLRFVVFGPILHLAHAVARRW